MDIDKLCDDLNNRVFNYTALFVDYNRTIPAIRVCVRLTPKFVKKFHFDDLIEFHNGKALMTIRLQEYAIELSNGEIVATREVLFF